MQEAILILLSRNLKLTKILKESYIYIKSHATDTYGASGHVDLIYSDCGNDPHIYQSDQELDDYLESRDGRGLSRWFSNGKLEVSVWITEYETDKSKK